MAKKHGKYAFSFETPVYCAGYGNFAGKKEREGPLGDRFDETGRDLYFGCRTMEQAEVFMQRRALAHALQRAGISREDLHMVAAGDLLNQCISSSYSFRESDVPYLGLYGACSTMALSVLVSAMGIEAGLARRAAAFTGSHFGTAERQYRFPLEYGGQRPPSAQHTVTAAGAVVLSARKTAIRLEGGAFGAICDCGVTDINNMGGAMAPAALQMILCYLEETGTSPADYDQILTGDLGRIGFEAVRELAAREGVDLGGNYRDCGLMIYHTDRQDMHAGGSGCGCSAAVLTADVLPRIERGEWRNVLFLSTGALMSPLSILQGESIPAIAHLLHWKGEPG